MIEVPEHLQAIYTAYPRKKCRIRAIKAICKALKDSGLSAEDMLAKTKAYATSQAWRKGDERNFIPHPSSWFNGGGYEDEIGTRTNPSDIPAPEGKYDNVQSIQC